MKKAKIIGKKTLSVFLAVLMVLTAWVWVAPTEASAANGSYFYKLVIKVTDPADGWDVNNVKLHYRTNNGRTSSTSSVSIGITTSNWNTENGEYTFEDSLTGFPCGYTHEYSFGGGLTWRGLGYTVTLSVGSSKSSYTQIFSTSYSDGSSAFSAAKGTFGTATSVGADKYPYVATSKSISAAISVANIGIPNLGDKRDVTISERSIQYYTTDQYGVRYEPTSYTVSGVEGLTTGTGWSMGNAYKISASSSTTKSTTDIYQTATVKLNWNNSNSNQTQHADSSYTFRVYNPRYKVTYNGNGGTLGTSYTYGYYGRPINHDTSTATPNNVAGLAAELFPTTGIKEGYTFSGIYTAATGGSKVSASTTVSADTTYYAHWDKNNYTATFYGTKANDAGTDTVEYIISTSTVPFQTVPTAPETVDSYSLGDYDYTFNAWDKEISAIGVNGAEYRATYTSTFVPAVYTDVDEIVEEANAIINSDNYEVIYNEESRAALENAVNSVVYTLGRTSQAVVDAYVPMIRNAIDGLGRQKYSVIFIDSVDNSVIELRYPVYYGDAITLPTAPTRGFTTTEHYVFKEWTPSENGDNMNFVSKNMIIIANYDKVAHTYTDTALSSNCTTQAGVLHKCSCGYEYVEYSGSVGTEHNLEKEWTVDIAPTCTTVGSKSHHCTRCSYRADITEIPALDHDFTNGYQGVVINPGCENDGAEVSECQRCGYDKYTLIPQSSHNWKETVVAPTCTSSGYTIKTCANCGDEDIVSFTDPVAHTYVENEEEYIAPTCTGLGKKVSYCSCGAQKVETVSATGHQWNTDTTTDFEATCTTKGQKSIHCSVCDIINQESITEIPKNGHIWGEEICEQKESCGVKGLYVKACSVCQENSSRIVAALTHNYVSEVVAPTCTTKGYTKKTCDICGDVIYTDEKAALDHAWTSTTHEADCTHSAYIEHVCGNDSSHNYVEYVSGSTALTHDFTGTETIISNATCEADGKKTVKCTRCDVTNEVIIPKLGHNYGEWDKTTNPATNDKDGTWTRECANCHNIETITIPKGGHNFVEDITKYVAPKCNAKGQRVYKCGAHENCIATVTVELDYAQHTIVKENKEATCTTAGYAKTYCSVCEEVFNSVDIPVKAHNYVAQDAVDATCTTSGYTPYKCENCTSTYNMYDENQPATGHVKWTEISRENATCTADGSVEYKCEKCTATKTEVLPKTGHNYVKGKVTTADCTTAGTEVYTCACGNTYTKFIEAAKGHTYGDWTVVTPATSDKNGVQKRICTACGAEEYGLIAPIGAHEFTATITTPATCTTEGLKTFTCSKHTNCSANYTEKIPATGHKGELKYTAPTCYSEGSTQIVCSVESCKHAITEAIAIPRTAHTYGVQGEVTTPATCTTDGEMTFTCTATNCGATRTEVIEKSGHDLTTKVNLPTCGENGSVITECKVCNDPTVKTVTELAAKGHIWNDGVVTTPATCTNGGVKTYTCTICGETKTEDIDALGHNWGEWTVTPSTNNDTGSVSRECLADGCDETETVVIPAGAHNLVEASREDASCTKPGSVTYTCNVTHEGNVKCGISVTVPLAMTQHELETTKTDAKCEADGEVVTKCEHCDTTTIVTIIHATGHSYTGKVTKEPSCTEEGVKTYTCAHDSKHTYTETIKKLPHTFDLKETVTATCTTRGYKKYSCACGESYVKFIEGEVAGHNYKPIENTATCVKDGTLTLECETCKDRITADVPALGHDYVEDISAATPATCKAPATKTYKCNNAGCGNTYVEYVSGTVAHTWGNWTTIQEVTTTSHGIEKRECSVCNVVEHKTTPPTGAHEFENKGEKPATCTEEGYINWVCKTHTDCEANYIETLDKLPHTEKIAYTDPTCTALGSTKIICDICKVTIGEEKTIPALGHTWNNGEVTTQPTCQTEGVMTFKCTVNGCNGTKTTAIAKNSNAHVYSVTTTEATCTTPATTVYKCACGDEKTVVTNFTLGHKWETEKTVEIPATCTSTGIKSTHCANCSETKDEETIPALNHTEKTEKIEATCTTAGYSAEVCDVCKTLLSSVVITEAKGHSWTTKTEAATCTDCATETKTCTVEGCDATETIITANPNGHTWGDWTIVEGQDKKVRECTVDGCDATEECPIPTSGHNWNSGEEITAATCYKEGEMKYTCQGCDICTAAGRKATETIAIPKLAHAYIKVTTPATCETNGSAVVKCSVKECGYEAATVTLPKIGHTLVRNVDGDKAATCNDIGWYAYKCNNLNCTYTEKIEVEALGHNYSTAAVETEQPTCTENGSKKYKCSRCDAAIVTEIPALGHSFTETTVVAPTCTDKGYTINSCSNIGCSEKYVVADSFTKALGHNWSEWETVTPATNDAEGLKKHICKVENCGVVEYAPIPMLGHQWNDGEVTTAATCETAGEKKYTCIKENCSVCNGTPATYTEIIPATGHKMIENKVAGNCLVPSYSEWTCENNCRHAYITVTGTADGHSYKVTATKDATCEENGEITYKCKDCGVEYTEVTPKLGHSYEKHEEPATCTTSGYTLYTCKNNIAHTYKEFNSEPKGHSLGAWTVTLAPTDTVDGTKERSCSKCNYKETQTVPALIHNMVETENLAATCKNTGHITYKCNLTHEGYDKACEYSYTVTLPVVAHSLTTEKSAPSCDKEGYIRTICNNTGCDYKEEIKTAALGHNWNDGETTPSTCQKQGNILYTCLRCGGTKTVKLELAQHTMIIDKEASKEATCTSRGYETYKCSVAGCSYGYSILGAEPTRHQNKKVETTPSTCKMSGLKKTICKDCNTILSVEVLPLAEHTYSSDVKAPTCTEMGYTIYTCGVCGDTYKDNYKSVVPHNFDETITENVTIVDATCTVDGSKTVKCKACNATEVTILPATGHINTSVVREESTCIKKGTEKVICACGHIVSVKELPFAEHNYEMTYENGVYTYTCKVEGCKHSYTETVETTFTVKFFAADKKTILKTEAVKSGKAATAPAAPSKGADDNYHYTFSEWDRDFTEITSDLDIYPTYEKEAHYGGAATCTEKAVCDECGTGYGETDASKHVIDTKLTPATCEKDGVLEYYCTENGCTYSKTEVIKKTGHSLGAWETYQNGNCATPTIKIRKCRNNGCKYYEQKESYGSHTWYIQPEVAPTCTTVGYSEYKYCTTCGMEIDSVVIPKLNHRDNDGDGNCDYCTYTEPVLKCNCMCHSTGFMKFIYSIVRFFWIITKSQPACNCGAKHY